jgi:uncharacterized repeat protein (TIGR01451 family)
MFNRLISNLPFNPSLITQVSFYAKRLKRETAVRRLGFLFIALTFFVQLFAVIAPPKYSLAEVGNDILNGGFPTQGAAVAKCAANEQDFGSILSYYGVSCDALGGGQVRRLDYNEYDGQLYSMGRAHRFNNDVPVNVNGTVYFMRPLTNWGAHCYQDGANCMAITGTRSNGTPFMVLFACGNIVIVGRPTAPPPPTPAKSVACSNLIMDIPAGSKVKQGTVVKIHGEAVGQNLNPGELADFYYDYVNGDTGQMVQPPVVSALGVPFVNGVARDPNVQSHTLDKPGHYVFRATVKYEGNAKFADYNQVGACAKDVFVNVPPVDVCDKKPGLQTTQEECDVCLNVPGVQQTNDQCKPCDKSKDDSDTTACLTLAKSATNNTQNINDANGTTAKGGDVITYTLSTTNNSKSTVLKNYVVAENITDVLEYADVTDYMSSKLAPNHTLLWPATDIKPGETIKKQFVIKIKNPIPSTPASASDPSSFDMKLTNIYGDNVTIKLPPSVVKTTEQVTTALPNTGPGTNLMIGAIVLSAAGYFFARSRLLAKELDLVKTEYVAGGV